MRAAMSWLMSVEYVLLRRPRSAAAIQRSASGERLCVIKDLLRCLGENATAPVRFARAALDALPENRQALP
jgi:hypothetical protein